MKLVVLLLLLIPLVLCATPTCNITKVFVGGEASYDSFGSPSVVTLLDKSVVIFAEAQNAYGTDLVAKRSFDHGQTWGKLNVLAKNGGKHFAPQTLLAFDLKNQSQTHLFLFFNVLSPDYSTQSIMMWRSDDMMNSWTIKKNITAQATKSGWDKAVTSPGHGIQLAIGRIAVPSAHMIDDVVSAHLMFSDDMGDTWDFSASLPQNTMQSQVAETGNGSLYINMHDGNNINQRLVGFSDDHGETWKNLHHDQALSSLSASIHMWPECVPKLIFVGMDGKNGSLTVQESVSQGDKWEYERLIFNGVAGPSDTTLLRDETIGVAFGVDFKGIQFANFDLGWIHPSSEREC